MKSKVRFDLLACVLAFGCGGNVFNSGEPSDAGPDASSGGDGAPGDSGVDWNLCSGPGQCVASLSGCCGPCGVPELRHFAGVNSKNMEAFRKTNCPVPTPCPACLTALNPYIGARCTDMHCQPFDTRSTLEFSKCAVNDDCRLRKGLDCCECGSVGPWTAIGISGQAALTAAVCAPQMGCDLCTPVPPSNLKAICTAGHCEVATDTACLLAPRVGCCFDDSQCKMGGRCYKANCAAGSEGICEPLPGAGQCWDDWDCTGGKVCKGATICPCGAACLVPDSPGSCQ